MFANWADFDSRARWVKPKLWPKRFLVFRVLLYLALRAELAIAKGFGMEATRTEH